MQMCSRLEEAEGDGKIDARRGKVVLKKIGLTSSNIYDGEEEEVWEDDNDAIDVFLDQK